ncbi:MAG: hypothetical protein ACXVRS_06630 [Gaiellaceae bacterium]
MFRRRRETKKLLKVARMLQAVEASAPRRESLRRAQRVGLTRA